MYPANPTFFGQRVRRLDYMGIPAMRTVAVTTNTTGSEVVYNLNRCQFRSLPNEGIILLTVNHTPASGSSAYKVSLATTETNTPSTTTSKVPLINGSGAQMVSSEVSQGNRYFIYYNKCQGIFQTVNHIIPPVAETNAVEKVSK